MKTHVVYTTPTVKKLGVKPGFKIALLEVKRNLLHFYAARKRRAESANQIH